MNFFARFKKLFLVIGFLALVFIIGYFIWRLFFSSEPSTLPPTDIETPGAIGEFPVAGPGTGNIIEPGGDGSLPGTGGQINPGGGQNPPDNSLFTPSPTAVGGLTETTAVNRNPSLDITLDNSGQLQYYDRSDGKFYKLNSDGTKTTLSDKVFHSVQNVVWAPNSDKAVLEYPDGSKIVYNFSTQKQVTLPSHWQDFSFSADGSRLVSKSIGYDTSDSWLIVSSDDGSQATGIEKIGDNYDKVYSAWSPGNQIAALYTEGVDFNRQEVYFVGLNGENFKSTIVEGRGFQPKWSSEGSHLLYSVYNSSDNYNPRLWVVDATSDTIGQNRRQLTLQTWANKCTFASDTEVYCAVPEELPRGAGLLPQLADETKDLLYKIDLTTGSQKLIAIPNGYYNISQIAVPEEQDYLYFTDKFSGSVYQIKLR